MGGPGAGHKSERARAARRINIQKARAARKREPLRWRSGVESRLIEQLVWQWWNSREARKWAKQRVARFLGVSHTWVNKLVKRFEADPERARRRNGAFTPASFEKLERAREETRRQREYGWLRGPIRLRRVKFLLGGKKRSEVVANRSEKRRREAEAMGRPERPLDVPWAELPAWARGMPPPGMPGEAVVTGWPRARPGRFFRR
jgi:hypothetical protein